ncbi:MAG: gamma-glutamyltransferase family protein [Paracoccaceae bacterium]|nr:gamma-glutamyltransferase family protein [Paracoccaceae bacterium]
MRDFQLPGRSPVFATRGICATSHPLAASTAVRILQDGGNAVDAAIAAAVLLGICEPPMTGLGGDCFALIKPPGRESVIALNGSGRSPAGLDVDRIRASGRTTMPDRGIETVTIPGAVDAFCRLATDHGRLGLDTLLAPAIHYAEAGVPVGPRTAFDWARAAERLEGAARRHFLFDGSPPYPGQIFRAPGQAEVLRRIAKDGREAFYSGEVAEDMVASLGRAGGSHVAEDFTATACEYSEPISGSYRDIELLEHAPNAQGATAILMARILAEFDLQPFDPSGAERAHLEAEAGKLAYDARDRFIGDRDRVTRLDHMLSDTTVRSLAALIDPERAMPGPRDRTEAVHRDTVYLAVVDRDLMAVSMIYSVFHGFGSGLASERFGISFQSRGAGFSLRDNLPNTVAGGVRPLHTIIPAMIRSNGRITMPFGVMGGPYQPTGQVRLVTNLVDYGMDPQTAIDGPRSFWDEGTLLLERGYPMAVHDHLRDIGHSVSIPEIPHGGAQAILIDHDAGVLQGASDPRKDGAAIGY